MDTLGSGETVETPETEKTLETGVTRETGKTSRDRGGETSGDSRDRENQWRLQRLGRL